MRPKILLWKNKCWESKGSNLGDLAIINATIESLRRQMPNVHITLLSDDPEYTTQLYGVEAIKISLPGIFRSIRNCDLVLIGGGTVFTDVSSMTIIPINTIVPLLGVLMGKPVAAWGIGSGKRSLIGQALVRLLMPYFRVISVRDEETRQDLGKLYPPVANKIVVTEDAAFSYNPISATPARQNRIVIAPRRIFHYKNSFLPFYLRKKLGLLPKAYFQKLEEFKQVLADLADYAVERYGATISFLPMYSAIGAGKGMSGFLKANFSSRDDMVCQDIHTKMRHREQASLFISDSPREVVEHLRSSRAVVGVPLHSLMLSHVAQTPFVGLAYQQKVARFMGRAGMQDFMIRVDSLDAPLRIDDFSRKLDAVLAHEDAIRGVIAVTNQDIAKLVNLPALLIANFLRTGRQFGDTSKGISE